MGYWDICTYTQPKGEPLAGTVAALGAIIMPKTMATVEGSDAVSSH